MKTIKIIACIFAIIVGFALIGYGYQFDDNDVRLILPTVIGAVIAFGGIIRCYSTVLG